MRNGLRFSTQGARLFFITIFFAFQILPLKVMALVDTKNANFSETYKFLDIAGVGFDLTVSVTYNSRSLHNGLFGFGWCSNFETSLEVKDNYLIAKECGDGFQTFYRPSDKKSTKLPDLRSVRDNTVYANEGVGTDNVTRKGELFVRTLGTGVIQRFDLNGQLVQLNDKNGNFLKMAFKGSQIVDATDNNGRKLQFVYDKSTQKVKEINGPNKTSVKFEYKNVSDLVSAKAASGNIYLFDYDDLHNMTKITYPSTPIEGVLTKELTYDKNRDWVMSLKDPDNCIEKYEYVSAKNDPKNHFWTNVIKTCGKEVTNRSKYEFWYKQRTDQNAKYLERVYMDVNGDKTDITYHPVFGRPLSLKRNKDVTTYSYLDSGLVKTRVRGKEVSEYKYDSKNRVKMVKIGKRSTTFDYDDRGNLKFAKNSNGQFVALEWDKNGRPFLMSDHSKRKLLITYDEKNGKAKSVERVGMGTMTMKYRPNGELDKVDSDGGATVVSQVAKTYNEMADVILPSGVELGF